jgi:hypothetical protein
MDHINGFEDGVEASVIQDDLLHLSISESEHLEDEFEAYKSEFPKESNDQVSQPHRRRSPVQCVVYRLA